MDSQLIVANLKATIDILISAFSLEYTCSKENALSRYVGPLLAKELHERGFLILPLKYINDYNDALFDEGVLTDEVAEVITEYSENLMLLAKGNTNETNKD